MHLKNVFINLSRLQIHFPLLFGSKRAQSSGPNVFVSFYNPLTSGAPHSPVIYACNERCVRNESSLSKRVLVVGANSVFKGRSLFVVNVSTKRKDVFVGNLIGFLMEFATSNTRLLEFSRFTKVVSICRIFLSPFSCKALSLLKRCCGRCTISRP